MQRHVASSNSRQATSVHEISAVSQSSSLFRQQRPQPSQSDSHSAVRHLLERCRRARTAHLPRRLLTRTFALHRRSPFLRPSVRAPLRRDLVPDELLQLGDLRDAGRPSFRDQTGSPSTATLNTPPVPGFSVTPPISSSNVVSSSCAVHAARSSQRHWRQYSISTMGSDNDVAFRWIANPRYALTLVKPQDSPKLILQPIYSGVGRAPLPRIA